jgi:hypothetical protein
MDKLKESIIVLAAIATIVACIIGFILGVPPALVALRQLQVELPPTILSKPPTSIASPGVVAETSEIPPTAVPPITVLVTVVPPTSVSVLPSSQPTQPNIVAPSGLFANLWRRYSTDLGSALPGNESDRLFTGAEMLFQSGHMFSATFPYKRIWVVMGGGAGAWTGSGTWREYRDTWQNGDPDFSCPKEADYPRQPIRGFGRVWCNNPEVRKALGWGVSQEIWPDDIAPGKGIQRFQEFERGFIFRDSDGWTNNLAYVFFANGTFVRQSY